MNTEYCKHADSTMLENGNIWCRDCECEYTFDDGTLVYDKNADEWNDSSFAQEWADAVRETVENR